MTEVTQSARTPDKFDWRLILRRVRQNRCVPFLGAGASLGFGEGPGLPTGSQLAGKLAAECEFPGVDHGDFFRVTQYYQMVFDLHELHQAIRRHLRVPNAKPSVVHRTIAALPFAYVLTTNFDDMMERAFRDAGKNPNTAIYERRGDEKQIPIATKDEPLVYKLHGTLESLQSMVVTEDDVVDFLACLMLNEPRLPPPIKSLFNEYSILFIGYGLKDLNVRVMLRALRGLRVSIPDLAHFAVQRGPEDPGLAKEWEQTVMFWGKREALQCFDMDAQEFMAEFKQRYDAEEGAT